MFYYEAKKVSDNPLAIEYTFATKISEHSLEMYNMRPKVHFYIKQNNERFSLVSVEILEVVGIDKRKNLIAAENGMMRAVLTFENVDPTKQFYFVYSNAQQTGRGYAIRFDN